MRTCFFTFALAAAFAGCAVADDDTSSSGAPPSAAPPSAAPTEPSVEPTQFPLPREDARAQLGADYLAVPEEPAVVYRDATGGPAVDGLTVHYDAVARVTTTREPAVGTSAKERVVPPVYGLLGPPAVATGPTTALVSNALIPVTNTTAWPYRAMVKLYQTYPNGQRFSCSGTLVERRFVLTAGHCVHNPDRGGFASSIRVIPGIDHEYMPFGDAWMVNIVSVEGWTKDQSRDSDYAMITLDRNIGDATGSFGYMALSNSQLDNMAIEMIGYPGETYDSLTQVRAPGNVDDRTEDRVYWSLKSQDGFSGSGVRRTSGTADAIFGINKGHGDCIVATSTFPFIHNYTSCGTRINAGRFDRIGGWINDRRNLPVHTADESHWMSLGGVTYDNVRAVRSGSSALDLFVRGTDGQVFRQHWDGTTNWTGWIPIGNTIEGSPAAVSRASGQLDLFARAADGAVWTKAFSGGYPGVAWPAGSGWSSLGGSLSHAPSATSWASNRLDVVGRSTSGAIAWRYWAGNGWSSWSSIGSGLSGAVALASWGPNRLDAIGRDTATGALHHWYCAGACTSASSWSNGGSLPDAVFPDGKPTLVASGSGKLDLFTRGFDGAVWHRSFRNGAWQGWDWLGGIVTEDIGAVSPSDGYVEVFVRGTDGVIYNKSLQGSTWWPYLEGWDALGAETFGTPTAISLAPGTLDVYVRDVNGATRTRWWSSANGWSQ